MEINNDLLIASAPTTAADAPFPEATFKDGQASDDVREVIENAPGGPGRAALIAEKLADYDVDGNTGRRSQFVGDLVALAAEGGIAGDAIGNALIGAAGSSERTRDLLVAGLADAADAGTVKADDLAIISVPNFQALGQRDPDILPSIIAEASARSDSGTLANDVIVAIGTNMVSFADGGVGDTFKTAAWGAMIRIANDAASPQGAGVASDPRPADALLDKLFQQAATRQEVIERFVETDQAELAELVELAAGPGSTPRNVDRGETIFQSIVEAGGYTGAITDEKTLDALSDYFVDNMDRLVNEAGNVGSPDIQPDGMPRDFRDGFATEEGNDSRLVTSFVGNVLLNESLSDASRDKLIGALDDAVERAQTIARDPTADGASVPAAFGAAPTPEQIAEDAGRDLGVLVGSFQKAGETFRETALAENQSEAAASNTFEAVAVTAINALLATTTGGIGSLLLHGAIVGVGTIGAQAIFDRVGAQEGLTPEQRDRLEDLRGASATIQQQGIALLPEEGEDTPYAGAARDEYTDAYLTISR
ncbi:MAG: hypothetical protein AAGE03_02070 [Pseudomonadota bacterium]